MIKLANTASYFNRLLQDRSIVKKDWQFVKFKMSITSAAKKVDKIVQLDDKKTTVLCYKHIAYPNPIQMVSSFFTKHYIVMELAFFLCSIIMAVLQLGILHSTQHATRFIWQHNFMYNINLLISLSLTNHNYKLFTYLANLTFNLVQRQNLLAKT